MASLEGTTVETGPVLSNHQPSTIQKGRQAPPQLWEVGVGQYTNGVAGTVGQAQPALILYSSVQFNVSLFIWWLLVKNVSRHFAESQSLTPNKHRQQEKPF